ncbi:hypothetical protein Lalb_Chr13g0290831 [Lupinus albus]|uniref:Uncharacterized protein n=1 Tax=Lupinus albus TaxID=3870 RepID=A0A6A4PGY6_LUPAL|nr:hypothetical protein Lalb_Chr13g0290831 [Lupinus albus]
MFFKNLPSFFRGYRTCNLLKVGIVNSLVKKIKCLVVSLLVLLIGTPLSFNGSFF